MPRLATHASRDWAPPARPALDARTAGPRWQQYARFAAAAALGFAAGGLAIQPARAAESDDRAAVAALDAEYQAAVERNDAATMERILADDFVLVLGKGTVYTKQDLLAEARSGRVTYERQRDTDRTVRVYGDTAVVTALLWIKGVEAGAAFERRLWFSDTYVRTPAGWRYVFGQASLPLPPVA